MKQIFTAPTITELYLMKGILENEGIETVVKNENLAGLAGDVPFMEAWPQLWVIDDEAAPRAEGVVADYLKS